MTKIGENISEFLNMRMENSVVRRSLILLTITSPGFLFSFLLPIFATILLPPESYGIFYLALISIDVLSAPAAIFNLFFSRHFVCCHQHSGLSGAVDALKHVLPTILYGAAIFGMVVILALGTFGALVGIKGHLLIAMIVFAAIAHLFFELGRGFLQGVHNFFGLAVFSVAVNFFRFALGLGLIALFGSAWIGIFGVGAAGIFGFAIYYLLLIARHRDAGSRLDLPVLPKWSGLISVSVGYGGMIGVAFADLVIAYFLFPAEVLSGYAASSVVPKTFLTLTLPIMQLFFPLSVLENLDKPSRPLLLLLPKGILAVLIVTVAASFIVLIGESYICHGEYGIRYCQSDILRPLLLSSVALSLVRTVVMYHIAKNQEARVVILILALAVFCIWVYFSPLSPAGLAFQFALFCWFLLAFYFAMGTLLDRLQAEKKRSS